MIIIHRLRVAAVVRPWEIAMAKKHGKAIHAETQSSPDGLREMAVKVSELVQTGVLDPRFGGKILRRIRDEAELMADPEDTEDPEWLSLRSALELLAAEVRNREADLFVAANARLREADESIDNTTITRNTH